LEHGEEALTDTLVVSCFFAMGHHRSVAFVEELSRMRLPKEWDVQVLHRDIHRQSTKRSAREHAKTGRRDKTMGVLDHEHVTPMAALGWSLGDIIGGINLVIDCIDVVKDSTGSAVEYRRVVGTLRLVLSSLHNLNTLTIDDTYQRQALHVVGSKCGKTIYDFFNRIDKFGPSLGTRQPFWKGICASSPFFSRDFT
jgi:hypothetical protein